jgi:exodeoxyribonuclease III
MLIGSWNVNSVRASKEDVKRSVQRENVDVMFLQELKGTEFPFEGLV